MTRSPTLFSLTGKRILLTGATGYLGSAMARGLAVMGATVVVNGRDRCRVEALADSLAGMGHSVERATFDVTDEKAVAAWFREKPSVPLHGLINNAYAGGAGSVEFAADSDYRDSYEIAIVATHQLLSQALPALRLAVAQGGGASVVNIASMYGVVSPDQRLYPDKASANPPFYGAAKAALIQWTRYAACEFGAEGIRVNSVSPGPFPSTSVQSNRTELVERLATKVPLGRIGQADEIQGPVAFLLSDAASYVNGANLVVDGGWTCW